MRVLLTSLSAGSGHVRAAEAILAAIHKASPAVEAVHVDVADFVTPNFRRLYVDGYSVAVNHAPGLWGHLYNYWDHQSPQGVMMPLLQRVQRACATSFFAYLHRFRPDRILTTHFLIPQLLSADHRLRCLQPDVETVITDYDVHRFWVSDIVSRYYVAHDAMASTLTRYGVPPSRITASGIPVHPCFSEPVFPAAILQTLQLESRRPVILMLAGGLGLNELRYAVEQLFSLGGDLQIITVSGKNETLRAQLENLKAPSSIKLVNLGYVRNMHELLSISDLVLTKPGGLTVSECLAKNKLMVLFSPIPGQEERNADFLTARGAAVQARSLHELPPLVARLLNNRPLREQMLANVKTCARPDAAYTIAQTAARSSQMAA